MIRLWSLRLSRTSSVPILIPLREAYGYRRMMERKG